MYSQAEFAPLSQASLKRLLKGHTVRVKHGTGLKLGLSKMQMKKHMASKKKGQGGYNLTMDPYQSQMHGEGFFEDVGSAFKKLGNSFVENVAKPVGREIISESEKQGRKVASQLIHQGIPYASEALGGIAGATLGGLATENPLGAEAGEVVGQRLGAYGGKKLADYVGKRTGLGMKQLMMTPQMQEAMKPRLQGEGSFDNYMLAKTAMGYGVKKRGRPRKGGTLLIDEPITARQVVNSTGNFFKNPGKTLGFGMNGGTLLIDEPITARQVVNSTGNFFKNPGKTLGFGMNGGTLLIDQPFTARQAVNNTGNFFKDPKGTLGFGMKKKGKRGGKLLIDQPFTVRGAVNTTGDFFKDPKGTIGFGMKKGRRGGALIQAGY
jgi:hypothetical protein